MTTFLTKTLLAAMLGLSTLGASVPAASAAGLDVTIETVGFRNGFLEVQDRDGEWDGEGRRGRDRWDRREERRHGEWGGRRGRCSPGLAVAKARDFGLRRAYVADVSRHKVVVEGFRRGDYRRIVFANDRGCPVLWR